MLKATKQGDVEYFRGLLARDPDTDINKPTTKDGSTLLHIAAAAGHADLVKFFLVASSVVDCVRRDGFTPLMAACENGHAEVVKELLAAKANVNAISKIGWTPLGLAAAWGHLEVLQLLLAAKVDIDYVDPLTEFPALYLAAQEGHLHAVRALLDARADANRATTSTGDTSLDIASSRGHQAVVDLLRAYGALSGKERAGGGLKRDSTDASDTSLITPELTPSPKRFRKPLHPPPPVAAAPQEPAEMDMDRLNSINPYSVRDDVTQAEASLKKSSQLFALLTLQHDVLRLAVAPPIDIAKIVAEAKESHLRFFEDLDRDRHTKVLHDSLQALRAEQDRVAKCGDLSVSLANFPAIALPPLHDPPPMQAEAVLSEVAAAVRHNLTDIRPVARRYVRALAELQSAAAAMRDLDLTPSLRLAALALKFVFSVTERFGHERAAEIESAEKKLEAHWASLSPKEDKH